MYQQEHKNALSIPNDIASLAKNEGYWGLSLTLSKEISRPEKGSKNFQKLSEHINIALPKFHY